MFGLQDGIIYNPVKEAAPNSKLMSCEKQKHSENISHEVGSGKNCNLCETRIVGTSIDDF